MNLTQFRSYGSMTLDCESRPVVLTGENGAGKTNLLEALSFFAPGRGLRSCKLSQVCRTEGELQSPAWYAAIKLEMEGGLISLGTGYEADLHRRSEKRLIKINGEMAKAQSALTDFMSVQWLTPQMDGLFQEGASERRKFLDRLIYTFDPQHSRRIYRYDHALRERSRLLKQGMRDPHWLKALEETMAGEGVAIAYARQEAVDLLEEASGWAIGIFPQASLRLIGAIDQWIQEGISALEVEDRLRISLEQSRSEDAEQGSAKEGPHRTDMVATYKDKGRLASSCSTGEQKAMLLSLIMASIRVQTLHQKGVPLVLLDEVVAHLDEGRREALYEEIKNLQMQVWMTGTDCSMFAPLKDAAQYFMVEPSKGIQRVK